MERDSKMTNLSFLFQFEGGFICITFFEIFKIFCCLGMHQVKIKVIYSAGLQLFFKKRSDIFLFFEIRICQFIRQDITVPGIS